MGDNENNVEIGNDIQLNIDNQKESKVIINNKIKTNENNPLKEIPYSELENDEENIKESQEQNPETIKSKIINKPGKYFFRKIGNCHFFFGDEDGNPLFIIGPQWYMFLFLTILVNVVVIFFLYLFWSINGIIYKLIGIILLSCFQIFYTLTFILNPGYPINDSGRKNGLPREKYRKCSECCFWVKIDGNVNHCYDCDICIEGYDHHCPWTSKCIGRKNLYTFYGFMGAIMLIFGFFIVSLTSIGEID